MIPAHACMAEEEPGFRAGETMNGSVARRLLILCAAFAVWAGSARAVEWNVDYPTYPTPDVRAAGMAGAYIGLASGPSAIYWNPAGLTDVGFPMATGDWYLNSRSSFSFLFASPLSHTTAAGVSWIRRRNIPDLMGEPEGLDRLDAALGTTIGTMTSVGVGLTYVNPRYRTTDTDPGGDGMGVDVNAGVNVSLVDQVTLSLVVCDLIDTKVHRSGGRIEQLSTRTYRTGVAWRPNERLAVAFQHDRSNRIGGEWFLSPAVGFRGGASHDGSDWTWTLGASLRSGTIRFDYAYDNLPGSSVFHRLGVELSFPQGANVLQMSGPQLRPLYASLGKTYAREPVGSVILVNSSSVPVATQVQLDIPHHAAGPTSQDITVRPFSRKRVFLHTVLSPNATRVSDDLPILGVISLVNPSTGEVVRKRTVQSYLYRSGALTWDDTRKAAAFVTPSDPAVRRFVNETLRPYRADLIHMPPGQSNISTAALLFEAAASWGIAYQVDPNSPYADAHSTRSPLDMLTSIGSSTLDIALSPVKLTRDVATTTIGVATGVTTGAVNVVAAPVRSVVRRDSTGADSTGAVAVLPASSPEDTATISLRDTLLSNTLVDTTARAVAGMVNTVGYGSLGLVDSTTAAVSGILGSLGSIGEESLRFLLYPYQSVVNPESRDMVVDDIQYPAGLLRTKSGDCDDSSVLMCTLMECAGVSTAFLESPEHIFMMFDTGMPVDEPLYALPAPDSLFFPYEGTYWIPVETTMLSRGFVPAWEHAAATLRRLVTDGQLPATRVSEAWRVFEPIEQAAGDSLFAPTPDSAAVRERFAGVQSAMDSLWRGSRVVTDLLARIEADPNDDAARAEAVYWLLYAGRIEEAEPHLAALDDAGYDPPRVMALHAVALYLRGDLEQAEATARQALELAPWVFELRVLVDQIHTIREES